MTGRTVLAGVASAALYGVALVVMARTEADIPQAVTAIAVVAGLAWVAAGLVALARWPSNHTGWLMLAAGDLWALGALQYANDDALFTVGAVASQLAFGPWIALTLAFPEGRLQERRDRVLVTVSGVALLVFPLLQALLVPDPLPTCDGCAQSAIVVRESPDLASALSVLGALVGIALSAAYIAILVRRHRTAGEPRRRILGPVYVVSVAGLAAIILVNVALALLSGDVVLVVAAVAVAFFGAVPLSFLGALLRIQLTRTSVTELLGSLDDETALRDALATSLGDPSLQIVYPHEEGWVDGQGRDAEPLLADHSRVLTPVEAGGELVAALVHDASLVYDGPRMESVVEATALALRTRGLQAEARAQFAFLRTLVETAPSLFLHIGTDGRIRNQNAAAVEAAGADDEEDVRGRPFWDVFIDPAERAAVIARFEAAAPAFPLGEFENAFTNPRGERRVIFWRSAPVRDARGRVTGIVSGGIDVTQRQLEAEARERERAFLNAIANNAPSLLCLIESDGAVAPFATNRAFERRLAVDPDAVGGEVFWERYVAPEDADAVREIVRQVASGETVGPHDHVWLTTAGERVDVSWSCTALPAMDERCLLLVSGVDVTDRRHREQELQRERDATTTVLESISSVVVVLDRDGTIRDRSDDNPRAAANRAFRQALGWRDVDLVNARFLDLLVEDDDGRGADAIATAAAGAASAEVESEWHCADGTVRAFAWSAVPVSDATGRRDVLVLVAGIDITERRQRALEDERRRAFVEAITETIPTYLVIVERDGTIREGGANTSFCDAFGWTDEEIAGEPFFGTVAPSIDVTARMHVAAALDGTEVGEIESRWDTRDGDSRIVAWTARPVTSLGGHRLVLIAGTDVTQRRLQEEEIRASRARIVTAADEARRRLERDLHDGAQQRLVALSVSLGLAESRLAAGNPGDVGPMLHAAREELGVALEELRELARGIHPAVLTDRGLGPALEALVARSPLDVSLHHCDAELPAAVEAAAYFVVAEALTNVAKYAAAETASVELAVVGRVLTVAVCDDGCGGADPSAGSGLRGLADRLAALDGRLTVESTPGTGTCVRAEIPLTGTMRA